MLVVIVVMVPLTLPKFFGYDIYAVLTGSMTPAYSVGSVIYVRECEAEEVSVGDVITYQLGTATDNVMTHRVVEIDNEAGTFITKGDANDAVDAEPVLFNRLIGKVTFCLPYMANVSAFVNTVTGKAITFIAFALAFILWILADMIAPKSKKKSGKSQKSVTEAGSAETVSSGAADTAKPKKRKKADPVLWAIRLLGLALVIGSGAYLCSVFMEYNAGENEYEELQQLVFSQVGQNAADTTTDVNISVGGTEVAEVSGPSEADLQIMQAIGALKEENDEVIGWITFDNMELSYPIMQGEDNDYYLTHTFSGETNSAGSIFMEAANTPNFEDCHTIIYGHNMKNLSMFGQLKKYKTEEFYEAHQYFTIYTEDHVYRYQIFAYYDIVETGDVYMIGFLPDEEFQEFINQMLRRSYYDTDVEVTAQDKVITLSTCSTEGNRFVVNAKRIETK